MARLRGRAARGPFRELILPITDTASAEREGRRSQHGGYRQIPEEARGLPVFSVVRDPFDLLVSAYEHGFWREHPIRDPAVLRRKHPRYPDLDFEGYVEMMHDDGVDDLLKGAPRTAGVGHVTLRFLKFFCREPDRVIGSLTDDDLDGDDVVRELARVRFLRNENLVPELRAYLAENGFPPETTSFMSDLPRINRADGRRGRRCESYYTPALRAKVRHAERLLFRLFPCYDR